MKKLLLFVLTSLFVGGALFAQTEESGKVKNEGNAAWRAKNYKEAFAKWEQYLKLIEFKDDATVYNVAVCANKLKDYANAEKYFGMSIKNNYKVASSYLGMADAQENLKKIPEMLKTLQDGIKATPGQNVKLEKAYSDYFAKEGQKFQKANDIAKAAENFTKSSQVSNKQLKARGLLSLGTLYFNNGASILQKATPFANSEKEKYEAEKAKAASKPAEQNVNINNFSSNVVNNNVSQNTPMSNQNMSTPSFVQPQNQMNSVPQMNQNIPNKFVTNEPTFIKNVPLAEKSEEDIEKEINNIFDHKIEEKHDEHIESLPPELASSEEYNTYDKPIVEPINSDIIKPQYVEPQEIKEEVKPVEIVKPEVKEEPKVSELGLEKPKVNIDVDSVIVNDKNNDEDFFDDFFGSEDE